MSPKLRILVIVFSLAFGLILKILNENLASVERPKLPTNQYWGEGKAPNDYDKPKDLQLVKPFFADKIIEDLSSRIGANKVSLTPPLEGVNFEYGFNTNYLKEILKYWKDDYLPRWREREIFIWQLPQYVTLIQGLRLHYLHLKIYEDVKEVKQMYPILLLHGWPSSVREFYELAPKLYEGSNESNIVFDIVAPSLPGFVWSQGASKKGMGPAQIAVILRNLMLRLGYKKFFIHGNDWGSVIGSHIATLFPENVLGYHSTTCTINTPLSNLKLFIASLMPSFYLEEVQKDFFFPLSKTFSSLFEETGYTHIQATKPDTIGIALSDNPVGLAAYIIEKFSTWTNGTFKTLEDGGLSQKFKLDTLLDNIMLYYLTNSITTSQRMFAEAYSKEQRQLNLDRVTTLVPTACARFKGDLPYHFSMDFQLINKYLKLVQSTYYNNGGHFAALQEPDLLYKDIIEFVKKAEKYMV
ncbi:juvenile hormone epoxide hydrolase 2-like [Episyrphus balteatus]|uniref:juvenile hormone epoxide hydrolase 2-like n=1 Tax=Episyrphus balteatus TaxID=286459 RepID=UPI002484F2B8|nr:juvenile hormone epoxide hydrolase 2-like [Episyrphus balteatus]